MFAREKTPEWKSVTVAYLWLPLFSYQPFKFSFLYPSCWSLLDGNVGAGIKMQKRFYSWSCFCQSHCENCENTKKKKIIIIMKFRMEKLSLFGGCSSRVKNEDKRQTWIVMTLFFYHTLSYNRNEAVESWQPHLSRRPLSDQLLQKEKKSFVQI